MADALSVAGLDYDVLTPKSIAEFGNYKVLVISSLETMSEAEVDAVREFVRNGGRLYISGAASLRDRDGVLHDNFMLSDVMGVDFDGYFDICPNYIAPVEENRAIFASHTRKYPHMINESMIKVKRSGRGSVMGESPCVEQNPVVKLAKIRFVQLIDKLSLDIALEKINFVAVRFCKRCNFPVDFLQRRLSVNTFFTFAR